MGIALERETEPLFFNDVELDPETSLQAQLIHEAQLLRKDIADVSKFENEQDLNDALKRSNNDYSRAEKEMFQALRRMGRIPVLKPFELPRLYEVHYLDDDVKISHCWEVAGVSKPRLFALAQFTIDTVTRRDDQVGLKPLHELVAYTIPVPGALGIHAHLKTRNEDGSFVPDSSEDTSYFVLGVFLEARRMLAARK